MEAESQQAGGSSMGLSSLALWAFVIGMLQVQIPGYAEWFYGWAFNSIFNFPGVAILPLHRRKCYLKLLSCAFCVISSCDNYFKCIYYFFHNYILMD